MKFFLKNIAIKIIKILVYSSILVIYSCSRNNINIVDFTEYYDLYKDIVLTKEKDNLGFIFNQKLSKDNSFLIGIDRSTMKLVLFYLDTENGVVKHIKSIGGRGKGPLEFSNLFVLGVSQTNDIITYDDSLDLFRLFNKDGELLNTPFSLRDKGMFMQSSNLYMPNDSIAIGYLKTPEDLASGLVNLGTLYEIDLKLGEIRPYFKEQVMDTDLKKYKSACMPFNFDYTQHDTFIVSCFGAPIAYEFTSERARKLDLHSSFPGYVSMKENFFSTNPLENRKEHLRITRLKFSDKLSSGTYVAMFSKNPDPSKLQYENYILFSEPKLVIKINKHSLEPIKITEDKIYATWIDENERLVLSVYKKK